MDQLTNWRQFFYASVLSLMINFVITLSKCCRFTSRSDHPSDIVLPTETTEMSKPGMFNPSHVQTLLRLFSDMINGAPISKPVIKKDCKTTARVKK